MVYPEKVIPLRLCLLGRLHLENENKWKFILHFARFALPLHVLITKGMPRQTRRKSGTGIYHVMLRGINRQDIFEEEEDYLHFLRSMDGVIDSKDERGEAIPSLCHFYAYCLMPNHVIQRVKKQTGEPSPGLKKQNKGEVIKSYR
jgi:hypothetical protein